MRFRKDQHTVYDWIFELAIYHYACSIIYTILNVSQRFSGYSEAFAS